MHSEDAHDPCDLTAQAEIAPGMRLVLVLEGAVDVSYGHRRVALAPAPAQAAGAMVALAEPDGFIRRARCGTYSRRVCLWLGREWLEQAGLEPPPELTQFMGQHLATRSWQPSPRALALAEQLVRPPPLAPLLQHLYLEGRTLELVGEALSALAPSTPAPAPATALRPREHQRLRQLHAYLASGQADELSLDDICRHAGVNATTLQRQFRAAYGITVFEHLRECRLQRARQALERDGCSVGQAALLAGYTSAANFATAYRRRFGLPPKLARARL